MTQYLICISKLIVVTVRILMIRDKTGVNSFMDLALIQWGKKNLRETFMVDKALTTWEIILSAKATIIGYN